jgi:hypothetical protein
MAIGACLVFKAFPNLRQSLPRPACRLTCSAGHFLPFLLPFRSRQIKIPSIRLRNRMRTEEPFLLKFASNCKAQDPVQIAERKLKHLFYTTGKHSAQISAGNPSYTPDVPRTPDHWNWIGKVLFARLLHSRETSI